MTSEQFLALFKDPFGSKSWRLLDEADVYFKSTTPVEQRIEELSQLTYNSEDYIDMLFLVNKDTSIKENTFLYITDDDRKNFEIQLKQDIKEQR